MKDFAKSISKERIVQMVWFLLILLGFVVTRLWKLAELPVGMHVDEVGMAYDAWCLSEYGVDRYLKEWPVYLINFGGGQSCLYAYLCAILFKIFGYSLFLVRIPAVFFSFLNLIFGMKLVKKVLPEKIFMPYIYGSLVAICPYFILASRIGLDCNLMLGMSTVFLYCFVSALDSEDWKLYCLAGLTGGLVLYTYALSYVVMPIFLIISLVYVIWAKKFVLKNWIAMAIPMGILACPLILVQCVNFFDLPEFQLGFLTITKLPNYRSGELGLPGWDRLVHSLHSLLLWDELPYNSIYGTPVLYGLTNVFFLIGMWNAVHDITCSFKEKEYNKFLYVFMWFLAVLFLGAMIDSNVNKLNAVYSAQLIIAVYGIVKLTGVKAKIRYVLSGMVGVAYIALFFNFATYYYGGQYTEDNGLLSFFDTPVDEAYEFVVNDPVLSGKVTQMVQDKIYFALGALLSPYDYQSADWSERFMCGTLNSTSDEYNYIVEDVFVDFMAELRGLGFSENVYHGYSLFYKK